MNQRDSRTLIKAREKAIEAQIILDCERFLASVLEDNRYGHPQSIPGLQPLAKAITGSKRARRAVARQLASTTNLHGIDRSLSNMGLILQNSALANVLESEKESKG